jgi:hypothetical protein
MCGARLAVMHLALFLLVILISHIEQHVLTIRWTTQNPFSQLYAKVSIPDICSIPIQVSNAGEDHGVSFPFKKTVIKIGRAFNTRRNTLFMRKGHKMWQNNDVTLISPPTMC